ncbi:hypothetical protein ANO11243_070970 [Dothideomycetidae sp. 11243]|nr:hypothetical protein ANO11243_070970 [fungal sp. No.11243]
MLAERGYLQAGGGSDDELPFVNQRRRCQVRAIDYYPAELADFACPALRPVTTDANASDDEMDIDLPSWEWNFFLLVQDGNRPIGPDKTGEKTWVHISDSAAQYLLNMDACDSLNQLAQSIDILCGNLRELKDEQLAGSAADQTEPSADPDAWSGKLSNIPFECCIQEYGQQLDAEDMAPGDETTWTRIFAMFETTIS